MYMRTEEPRFGTLNAGGARAKVRSGGFRPALAPGGFGSGNAGAATQAGGTTDMPAGGPKTRSPKRGAVFPTLKEGGPSAGRAAAARYQPSGTKAGDTPKHGAGDARRTTLRL